MDGCKDMENYFDLRYAEEVIKDRRKQGDMMRMAGRIK